MTITFEEVVETVRDLSPEQQDDLIALLHNWRAQARRQEIARDAVLTANVRQTVPFLWVHDIEAAVRYYVGLGFAITQKWIHAGRLRWCWLQLDGAALMLQEFWAEGAHANVPEDKLGVGVAINFICEDALQIYCEVTARSIAAEEPFVGNAMWVVGLTDPDGYRLYFESPTNVPEETRYSEWEVPSAG